MKKSLIILLALILSFFTACEKKENQLPTCAITYPNNEDVFEQGDTINISVEANDNDGSIVEINYNIDDIKVFSSSSFPYGYSWNTLDETIGNHIIKVTAKDNDGGSKTDECTISILENATVITIEASSITHNSAISGGNITYDGGTSIIENGVCWNTSQNPTLSNEHTTDGSDSGAFTSSMLGLTKNTAYYVRAYATNSIGTSYGSEVTFTTLTTPAITTTAISAITENSTESGGNVTDNGGTTVTARGVCWSTSQNPTSSDNKTTNGNGIGSFTSSLTELSSGTIYYLRAYATNSAGSGYGQQVILNTYSGTITDFNGNVYYTVNIGNQVWMAENLAYLPSVSPSSDGSIWNVSYTDPYYYVYGYQGSSVNEAKATSNYTTYGVLYNWPAAMAGASSSSANPSGVQGVCPDGWHLPSNAEWTELTDYLGGTSVAGGKLKETGTTHWNSPNTGADNSSGFSALPGGSRSSNNSGSFGSVGYNGFWWSSTETRSSSAWSRFLNYTNVDLILHNYPKSYGFSIRCVRD